MGTNYVTWVGDAGGTGPRGGGGRATIVIDLRRSLRLLLGIRIEFGEVAGCSVGRLCVCRVARAGIWVAGLDGVLLWEPAGWLESADAGGLETHLSVRR